MVIAREVASPADDYFRSAQNGDLRAVPAIESRPAVDDLVALPDTSIGRAVVEIDATRTRTRAVLDVGGADDKIVADEGKLGSEATSIDRKIGTDLCDESPAEDARRIAPGDVDDGWSESDQPSRSNGGSRG